MLLFSCQMGCFGFNWSLNHSEESWLVCDQVYSLSFECPSGYIKLQSIIGKVVIILYFNTPEKDIYY